MSGENGKNKKKISFLVIYAASLLTIALVLLLLSYFQQRRANEQIGSLEAKHDIFSTSALQSIDGMRESLVELEAKNKELEESLESVQSENNSLRARNSELEVEVGTLKNSELDLKERITELENDADRNTVLAADMWRVISLTSEKEYEEAAKLAVRRHAEFAEIFCKDGSDGFYSAYEDALETLENKGAVTLERDGDGAVKNVSIPQEG